MDILRKTAAGVLLLFILTLYSTAGAFTGDGKMSVLFISSYTPEFNTVPEQIAGIREALPREKCNLDIEYMDSRRFSDAADEQRFLDQLQYKLVRLPRHDAIILGDDAALSFALKHRNDIFRRQSMAFLGINNVELAERAWRDAGIPGVIEAAAYDKNILLAQKLFPKTRQIIAVVDGSPTGQGDREQFMSYAAQFPAIALHTLDVSRYTRAEFAEVLENLDPDSVLFYLTLFRDGEGNTYTIDSGARFLREHARVPIFRASIGGIGEGILGGYLISYRDSGRQAGEMVQKLLAGKSVRDIPLVRECPVYSLFDREEMDRFHLVKSVLPEDTVYVHDRPSFYEKYREVILPALALFAILLMVTLFFFMDSLRHRRLISRLRASEDSLSAAIEHSELSFWEYNRETHEAICIRDAGDRFSLSPHMKDFPQSYIQMGRVHAEDIPAYKDLYARVERGDRTAAADVRLLSQGVWRWFRVRYTNIFDELGTCIKSIGTAMDITPQKLAELRYHAEEASRRALEQDVLWRDMFNVTQDRLLSRTQQGVETDFSQGSCTMEEMLSEGLRHMERPEDREFLRTHFTVAALRQSYDEGRRSLDYDYVSRMVGGVPRWFNIHIDLIEQPETRDILAVRYFRDIDEKKKNALVLNRAIDEELDFLACVDVPTQSWRVLKSGKLMPGVELKVHYDFMDAQRQYAKQQVIPEERQHYLQEMSLTHLQEKLQQASSYSFAVCVREEAVICRKQISCAYLPESRDTIFFVQHDITGIYEEEERQRQLLHQASEAKSIFLSRMSHEIRTPMNAIIGLSELIKQKIEDADYVRKSLDKIDSSARFLLSLINDILDISRIERGKLELSPESVKMGSFLENIHVLIQARADEKHVQYAMESSYDADAVYSFDTLKLGQVLINILSNAVKFTPEDGQVRFFVSEEKREETGAGCFCFVVQDNGIGIDPGFLPNIFDAFAQEYASNTTKYGGTGLGLSISKSIIDLMDGSIEIDSCKGKGTIFRVRVRLEAGCLGDPPVQGKELSAEGNLAGVRVLVVEDNEINREIAQSLLEMRGMLVETAVDGQKAIEKYLEQPAGYYALILMDVRMPVMDGLTAAARIRASGRPDAESIPILAMTANAFQEDVKKSLDAGMNAHLTKPIEPVRLYAAIEQVLLHPAPAGSAAQKKANRGKIRLDD